MSSTDDYKLRRRLLDALAAQRALDSAKQELADMARRLQDNDAQLKAAQSKLGQLQRHYLLRVWRQLAAARREPARLLHWPRMAASLLKRRLGSGRAAPEVLPSQPMPLPDTPVLPALGEGLGGEVFPLQRAQDVPADLRELRLALISDRFTADSLRMECRTCDLRPGSWQQQIQDFMPHLVLVESAWQGVDGEWSGRVSEPDEQLCALVMSCRSAGIPCVFWNKEDPLHFEAFLRTAALFDHVYTTDAAAVLHYRQRLGHERVTCLPFAVQPRLHHPFLAQGEERAEASFFAGAWYPHLHERCRDFRELADALELAGPLVIHDRNGNGAGNNYPPAYANLVRAAVPYEQTGMLYRSYRIGLTLNTIKQSPTMFARRAMELACTNTSVYSNYSQGLAVLMGDLVRMSDHGPTMLDWAWQELREPQAPEHRHRRLRALRKVVCEHTWQCRLQTMAEQILGMDLGQKPIPVAILAAPTTQAELDRLLVMCQAQKIAATLWISPSAGLHVPDAVQVLTSAQLNSTPGELFGDQWVAIWHPDDGYGPDYLADLLAARHFDQGQIIGKACYLDKQTATPSWRDEPLEYRFVDRLAWRRSIAPASLWTNTAGTLLAACADGAFTGNNLLSIDRESYACGGDCLPVEATADEGLAQHEIDAGVQRMLHSAQPAQQLCVPAALLSKLLLQQPLPEGVSLAMKAGSLELVSRLAAGITASLPTAWVPAAALSNTAGRVCLRLLAEHSSQYALLLEAADSAGNRLYQWPLLSHTAVTLPEDSRIHTCRLVLQVVGNQVSYLSGITTGGAAEPLLMPGNGRLLVIANGYPRRGDLYRNAFIHRRVKLYQQRGIAVDVVWLSGQLHRHSYEFDGVRVQVCDAATLAQTLHHSKHLALAVHFLDPDMWQAIRAAAERIRTVVWVHGAEAQAWTRRSFLYQTEEAKAAAQQQSSKRMQFWRELVEQMPESMRLVFVSRTQAEEVQQDLGMELPEGRWRVIHNPIDTALFAYEAKSPAMRRRVLSIRPHASKVYANDLVAAAIHEMARHEEFAEWTFTLVGDGRRWDEDFAGLEKFPNVTLQRGFVSQNEIKALHDTHGVFLVPSRADTQGVSRDEAMSSGLVPVTTALKSISEFVDSECGMLCAPEDVSALIDACRQLECDKDFYSGLSVAASRRVRRQSSAESMISCELSLLGVMGG